MMPSQPEEKPDQLNPIGDPMAVTPETISQFFLLHRHDGSAMGGQTLYGPYFIRDTVNGKLYKITSVAGVLTLVQV